MRKHHFFRHQRLGLVQTSRRAGSDACDPFQAQSDIIFHPIYIFCDFWEETKNKNSKFLTKQARSARSLDRHYLFKAITE